MLKPKFLTTNYYLLSTNSGQSLFEVVVAVGLSALILVGIASLSSASVRNSGYSRNNAQATKYAQEALEWLRSQRDAGWNNLLDHSNDTGKVHCINTLPPSAWDVIVCQDMISGTTFSRTVTLTTDSSDSNKIDAFVTVSWTDAQGTHNVKSQTRFTNWR